MSLTNTSSSVTDEEVSRNHLMEKILYHGHRLRNAMVQSILDHDPFNTEIFDAFHESSLITTRLRKRIPSQYNRTIDNGLLVIEKKKVKSFLKGDSMNQQDQVEALETLRSMSSEDICRTTNEAYRCACSTCLKYDKHDLNCDLNRFQNNLNSNDCKEPEGTKQSEIISFNREAEVLKYLKYVDCLQISIHDLILNEKGNKKVNSYLKADKKRLHWESQTVFVDYELPFILSILTPSQKVRKSVTNINNNNFVRMCARRISNEAVHFKHTSVHNIKNLDHISLEGIKLKFQITCRTMKQKNSTPVGYAQFDFANFVSSPTLTCTEELPINFDDTVPIILGNLHVTLQMGYGRLYFGKEFIACFEGTQKHSSLLTTNNDRLFTSDEVVHNSNIQNEEGIEIVAPKITQKDRIDEAVELGLNRQKQAIPGTKSVLFGFIYISEAQYTKADINSFITCRPFCQEEKCYSQLVRNETKPIFNFSQLVPLIYDERLLQTFRDNFMVIEFWEKLDTEGILFGVTKLQLNQFYFAYRNADITKYLLKNKLPVISFDWWEEIINPYTDEFVGQVQVLFALGTEEQIRNLQIERGFNTNSVKANYQTPLEKNKIQHSKQSIFAKSKALINKKEIQASTTGKLNYKSTAKAAAAIQKIPDKSTKDQGVQCNIEMDSEIPIKEKSVENGKLEQIMSHLRTMRNQQHVALKDKNRNTDDENKLKSSEQVEVLDSWTGQKGALAIPEDVNFNTASSSQRNQNMSPLVRSTSELLNTLKAALSVPPPPLVRQSLQSDHRITQPIYEDTPQKKSPNSFKVHIAINQAMHLPVHKKCKAKKNKGKTMKTEDNVKPSSYVTFETMPGLDLKMSPLVQKSTNPVWNYEGDALLPTDLLTDNKQRLIFKVWRKSTNTNLIPNLQTDSIIGFAAVDVTVLLSGLPNIKGWFNIMDLSSKCNGQINIHITPLEDLAVFRTLKDFPDSCTSTIVDTNYPKNPYPTKISLLSHECPDDNSYEDEADGELLSRALKRQFTELDEITQRLRLRLSFVTNEETEEDDEIADQFERDINTLSIEEDFDMVNFEQEVSNNAPQISDLLKIECSSETSNEHTSVHDASSISTAERNVDREVEESLSILDRQLLIGKHRIDILLGKLSLISGDMKNSRYISGYSGSNCEESANIDTEAILKDLNRNSRPNIHASTSYDKDMFQQIYEYPNNEDESNLSSNTSVISHLEESIPPPDGEGTLSEAKNKLKNIPM